MDLTRRDFNKLAAAIPFVGLPKIEEQEPTDQEPVITQTFRLGNRQQLWFEFDNLDREMYHGVVLHPTGENEFESWSNEIKLDQPGNFCIAGYSIESYWYWKILKEDRMFVYPPGDPFRVENVGAPKRVTIYKSKRLARLIEAQALDQTDYEEI